MSQADEFRRYADEAMRWACHSKTDKEKRDLLDLARTWTEAALRSEFRIDARGVVPSDY
jgi:hypothetical protein